MLAARADAVGFKRPARVVQLHRSGGGTPGQRSGEDQSDDACRCQSTNDPSCAVHCRPPYRDWRERTSVSVTKRYQEKDEAPGGGGQKGGVRWDIRRRPETGLPDRSGYRVDRVLGLKASFLAAEWTSVRNLATRGWRFGADGADRMQCARVSWRHWPKWIGSPEKGRLIPRNPTEAYGARLNHPANRSYR